MFHAMPKHLEVALNLIVKARLSAKFFIMKVSLYSYANKTNFHMKSVSLSLAFIMSFRVTRKWPIGHELNSAAPRRFSTPGVGEYSLIWAI